MKTIAVIKDNKTQEAKDTKENIKSLRLVKKKIKEELRSGK